MALPDAQTILSYTEGDFHILQSARKLSRLWADGFRRHHLQRMVDMPSRPVTSTMALALLVVDAPEVGWARSQRAHNSLVTASSSNSDMRLSSQRTTPAATSICQSNRRVKSAERIPNTVGRSNAGEPERKRAMALALEPTSGGVMDGLRCPRRGRNARWPDARRHKIARSRQMCEGSGRVTQPEPRSISCRAL